ncbi:MAG TPA: pyrroline-5-carboxylate reductase [Nevskiaceae bacterium]|nr:pyrroline-5-carboxylate reductase [Nevskiaceae bacterium]
MSAATLAFIGGGNMAASLIGGWCRQGAGAGPVRVAEPLPERRAWLARELGVAVFADNAEAVQGATAVVLAIKPQQMEPALAGLRLAPQTLVLSIAAGVGLARLRHALGAQVALVRSMPNTPALVGAGISGLYAEPGLSAAHRDLAERILGSAGPTVWLGQEAELDAVTALSGSGPAYFFLVTECLTEAGIALGLSAATARALARQTLIGSGRLVESQDTEVAELRRQVTSKGGTTEAALGVLESAGLRTIFERALHAAAARSQALGQWSAGAA